MKRYPRRGKPKKYIDPKFLRLKKWIVTLFCILYLLSLNGLCADGNIPKAAVCFGAEFYPSQTFPLNTGGIPGTVKHGSFGKAAEHTIRNGYILCDPFISQPVTALENHSIIDRCIYRAVGNPYILAAVKINTITIAIDLDAVDSHVVATGCKYGKMTGTSDGNILDHHIST